MRHPPASRRDTSQSLEDKLQAFKFFLAGKGIPFVVVKATTTELIGPKKKHLVYLVNMTNEPNVSIPNMVKHLMLRARCPDWSVAFKAIITIHHLMTYGNEKFIQNLASSTVNNRLFDRLGSYADRTTTLGYNMSVFLRRYARYINNKIQTYRSLGMDFCRVNKFEAKQRDEDSKQAADPSNYYYYTSSNSYYVCQDESVEASNNPTLKMKTMPIDQLLKIIPIIQAQFDALLAFDVSADNLCNGIINSAFNMLYRDFLKLYIVYQLAIIRLLELYFSNNIMKRAREMLELYKKFLVRMDKVSDFLPVVDSVGLDKSDLPNLSRAPSLPLQALEKHIEALSRKYYGDCNSTTHTSALNRMQSVELPRIEYGTLGRPRRRSLRTPTLSRQGSIDLFSPMAGQVYKRQQDEIRRLDKMLNMTPEIVTNDRCESANAKTSATNSTGLHKRKRNCDHLGTPATLKEDDNEANSSHRYEELVDSLLGIDDNVQKDNPKSQAKASTSTKTDHPLVDLPTCGIDPMTTFDSGVANDSTNQHDSLLLIYD